MIFSIGACGYGLLEILWRGYTHWSMLGAGGLSFLGLSAIQNRMRSFGLVTKAIIGSGLITAIEFVFGVIFNIVLKKNVWDYSRLPFQLFGQICLPFMIIFSGLCVLGILISSQLAHWFYKEEKPHYHIL